MSVPPGPSGPPAWPFVLGGVLVVAVAVAATVVFLDPFGGGGGEDGNGKREVPDDAVAVVDDEEISRENFDHWLVTAAKSQARGGGEVVVPDPPGFERCIADEQQRGSNKSREELEARCRSKYEGLRDQTMQFLVSSKWIEIEAEERDISVSDEDVRESFEDQKDQTFDREREYQEFLRTSGQTEEDLLYRVRIDMLTNMLREAVVAESSEEDDQEALNEFVDEFRERYREMTLCADDFTIDECSNGPPLQPDTGTIPAPTTPRE